jgi:hypothetical protein
MRAHKEFSLLRRHAELHFRERRSREIFKEGFFHVL